MKRRTLLTVGAAAGALLTLAGITVTAVQPARRNGQLTPHGQELMAAVAKTVLGAMLPPEGAARQHALAQHLIRLQATLLGLPAAMQAEVDEMLTLLASSPGRLVIAGLSEPWAKATPQSLTEALQNLRTSRLDLRQQIYRALRDLTNASYFADPGTWAAIGYPGPRVL